MLQAGINVSGFIGGEFIVPGVYVTTHVPGAELKSAKAIVKVIPSVDADTADELNGTLFAPVSLNAVPLPETESILHG